MALRLMIAEKPSVAQTIAAALGIKKKEDGYIEGGGCLISWCVGYLVQLAEAAAYGEQYKKWSFKSLPILPEEWQYTVGPGRGKRFKALKGLMHRADVPKMINACDAGREGKLIFHFVYETTDCKKPMRRLWISSMGDGVIKAGFASLRDGWEYDALFVSVLCRARADWLIGINATRLFSCLHGKTSDVGHVQTPILKMLIDRDAATSHFQKERYYHMCLDLSGVEAVSERVSNETEAAAPKGVYETQTAVCISLTEEKRATAPPKLFDLTSLQRGANRTLGYTAKQTLDPAQALYEKRLLTYSRADNSLLTDDMGGIAAGIIALPYEELPLMADVDFMPSTAKVSDSKKVSNHHAVILIMELAKVDPNALLESERSVLTLTGARLLLATAESYTFRTVTAVFLCADMELATRGKTVLSDGWKEIERRHRATLKQKPEVEDGENEGVTLPELSEGRGFPNPATEVTEHTTTSPRPHSETLLLSAVERAGNGDINPDAECRRPGISATRVTVIEELVKDGFAEHKGKQPIPTQNGVALILVLPDMLTSPQFIIEWENNLTQITKGAADLGEFLPSIEAMAREFMQIHTAAQEDKKGLFREEGPSIGKYPRCDSLVHEGKRNCYCNDREYAFVMQKNGRFFEERKTVSSSKIAATLLKSSEANVKKLYPPKTGKAYDGTIVLVNTGGKYVNYRIEVWKN